MSEQQEEDHLGVEGTMKKIDEEHKLELIVERNEEECDNELWCDKKEDKKFKVELSEEKYSTIMAYKSAMES